MNKNARLINDVAIDVVIGNPTDFFHPDIASQFVAVPDSVQAGSRRVGQAWNDPESVVAPQPPIALIIVSPVEFKLLFTPAERMAIKAARTSDPVIDDFFEIIDDPRLTEVNFGLASTCAAVDYLAAQGLITVDRAAEIKTGQLK